MAKGLVVNIIVGDERHTELLTRDRLSIGTDDASDLQITLPEFHANQDHNGKLLELFRQNGKYAVVAFDERFNFRLNGKPLSRDARITDGDRIEFADSTVALQFFPVGGLPAVLPSMRLERPSRQFLDATETDIAISQRRDEAKVFLRDFTRELIREISPLTKFITLAITLLTVGSLIYFIFGFYREVKTNRRLVEDQQAKLANLDIQAKKTVENINELNRGSKELLQSLSIAPKIRSDFGNGVCLISGVYYFADRKTGKPLRYPDADSENTGVVANDEGEDPNALQLTPDGNGTIAEYEFIGTGFYVGEKIILTNRHVVQPWSADERTIGIQVSSIPKLKRLQAFFPDRLQPIPLRFRTAAQQDDVAVCSLETTDDLANLPTLPLDADNTPLTIASAVVLMGFPSGTDHLLSMIDDERELRAIQQRCGARLETLVGCLSEQNRVRPLTTRGFITDLDNRRIVFDARTQEGGSGSPLFSQSGKVVGINFAISPNNSASNFAVPIRFGITLLKQIGWNPPQTDANPIATPTAAPTATPKS